MTTPGQWTDLIGSTAIDAEGQKIGKVGQIYLDDTTGQPVWVTVSTGLFGMRESFAPLYNARPRDGELQLAVTKQLIKDAPNVDTDGHLAESEIDALYQHYAGYLDPAGSRAGAARPGAGDYATGAAGTDAGYADRAGTAEYADTGVAGRQGRDVSGPNTDDAMTRSEERLRVGTENVAAGRARLRKYVVTEPVTTTVPVSHEEVRVEREPITDANAGAAMSGPDISEEEHEVTLRAERPVVDKEAVPVERVRLGTETVTEEHQVNEEVRKEQIEEPDVDTDPRRSRR
jgi:uncharacterized protein (TIGR02271 family)